MPLIQTDDPNAPSLLQYLYTGVLWVDEALNIRWVNTQAEQLFATGKSRLLGASILDILLPLDALNSDSTNVNANYNANANTNANTNSASAEAAYVHGNHSTYNSDSSIPPDLKPFESASNQLMIQFAYAKNFQQPFIEYDRDIKGVLTPLLVDYSVTPVDQMGKTYFLVELWGKSRQSRFDREHQMQQQHEIAKDMLRSISHEVKNPLAGIRGAAQLLVKQIQKQEKKKPSLTQSQNTVVVDALRLNTYANIVISETDRLAKLISQLLGSNTLPEWEWINIHEPLEHVLMLTQTQHPKVKIERNYDLSIPNLKADKNQIIQVFLNLVNNACDAMLEPKLDTTSKLSEFVSDLVANPVPDSVSIPVANSVEHDALLVQPDTPLAVQCEPPTLTISTRIERQYTIGTVHHRQLIKIGVHDNGKGIDPQIIDRIFFPLFTGRASGTGLGLALVQDMVHQHHGAIEVDSEAGNTVFWIYLPFESPQ